MQEKPKIIVILGPTASGKSNLGVVVARKFGGEIISADSRQVYRGLDLGTGKITRKEMQGIPHHLLDVASPKRTFTVTQYHRYAKKCISEILSRGNIPIIVGGTGLYIDTLIYDREYPNVKPDHVLRKKLERESTEELAKQLEELDQIRWGEVDKLNRVRLIRAIEIATHSGLVRPLSQTSPYDVLWIGTKIDMETLRERIHVRLIKRIKQGMLAEFSRLHSNGLSFARMERLGLEYRYGARYLHKMITKEEFITQLTNEIVKYSKRQMTWFKKNTMTHWVEPSDTSSVNSLVQKFLQQ